MAKKTKDNYGVAVTGIGMVTAQGHSHCSTWNNVLAMRDALAPWEHAPPGPLAALKVASCGKLCRPMDLPPRLWKGLSRTQQLAAIATDEALAHAGLPHKLDAECAATAGLFMATSVTGMDVSERYYQQFRIDPASADVELLRRINPYELIAFLGRRHNVLGRRYLCLTTCVGSAMALGAAADWLSAGKGNIALAGGSEAFCRVVFSGFNSLKLVAAEGCRPFDKDRPGITVGEGAAVLILERPDFARQRGAIPLVYLRGFSATCDAHHLTAPDPAGTYAAQAIEQAIERSGISKEAIGYINAHGTGTKDNDAMETAALRAVFGLLPAAKFPAVSSTKRLTGHTFAAAGAIEAALVVQALQHGELPGNAGTLRQDPALDIPLIAKTTASPITAAISCNFAFGGNNTALVFSREAGCA